MTNDSKRLRSFSVTLHSQGEHDAAVMVAAVALRMEELAFQLDRARYALLVASGAYGGKISDITSENLTRDARVALEDAGFPATEPSIEPDS